MGKAGNTLHGFHGRKAVLERPGSGPKSQLTDNAPRRRKETGWEGGEETAQGDLTCASVCAEKRRGPLSPPPPPADSCKRELRARGPLLVHQFHALALPFAGFCRRRRQRRHSLPVWLRKRSNMVGGSLLSGPISTPLPHSQISLRQLVTANTPPPLHTHTPPPGTEARRGATIRHILRGKACSVPPAWVQCGAVLGGGFWFHPAVVCSAVHLSLQHGEVWLPVPRYRFVF